MTTYPEFLGKIDVGSGVAENDSELDGTFVQTQDYDDFITGKRDLITGVKGSGKSALFLAAFDDPPAETCILSAQPLKGPTIHDAQIIQAQSYDVEDYLTERWLVYSALLAVSRFPESVACLSAQTQALLRRIATGRESERELWILSERSMREGGVEGVPFSDEVMRAVSQVLEASRKIVWLCFDRLDDVTFADMRRELTFVRSLIRAHIHLARGQYRVRPKTFMRSDIMRRATDEHPIRNLDKISQLHVNMNSNDLSMLLIKRFARSDDFVQRYLCGNGEVGYGAQLRTAMATLFPAHSNPRKHRSNLHDQFGYVFRNTTDGTGQYSPRSVLSYVRHALTEERRDCEKHHKFSFPAEGPLLTSRTLNRAWITLSQERIHSYLYAEFPNLRPFIEQLERGPATFREGLPEVREHLFGDQANNDEAREVINHLLFCGVLGRNGKTYFVGQIYRPALRMHAASKRPRASSEG